MSCHFEYIMFQATPEGKCLFCGKIHQALVPSGVRFEGTRVCEKLSMTRRTRAGCCLLGEGVFRSCPPWEHLLLFPSHFPVDAPARSALVAGTVSRE